MLLLRLGVQVGLLENRFEVKRCIEGGAAAGEAAAQGVPIDVQPDDLHGEDSASDDAGAAAHGDAAVAAPAAQSLPARSAPRPLFSGPGFATGLLSNSSTETQNPLVEMRRMHSLRVSGRSEEVPAVQVRFL